ncbi:class I SAM-dependent methyltransferase [Rhodoplanes roseus]|nr:methyltransferase domain-containing protein [Rhodoplanes roseus]
MAIQWADYDLDYIRRRYDRIASLIVPFEWLLFMPTAFRRTAVEQIGLAPGERVLEIGCGTGRNLPFLREAVGPSGRVYGVDFSAGMLARARSVVARGGWDNVHLTQSDAADYRSPEPLDAVMFGLSYNTMPHHRAVLARALELLEPGGRIVIMDAKLPPGIGGKLVLPFSIWLMKKTVLGNPYIRPWEHLEPLVDEFRMDEFLFGSYYVCRGIKRA